MNRLSYRKGKSSSEDSSFTVQQGVMMAVLFVALATTLQATQPTWWNASGAVNASAGTNDYMVANQGQLKQFTQKATLYLDTNLPGGAGANLDNMVSGWSNYYATNGYSSTNPAPQDFQAVNQGQLKYVGNLIWTNLYTVGYTNSMPTWLEGTNANDYGVVNLGQLKTVFNFDLLADSDGNGLPDWWELKYFGATGQNSNAMAPNGSGLTLLQSYQEGLDPQPTETPQQPEALGIAINATGPFQYPANPVIVTSITHPSNTTIVSVAFYGGMITASSGTTTLSGTTAIGGTTTISGTIVGTVTSPPDDSVDFVLSNLQPGPYSYTALVTVQDPLGVMSTAMATTQFQVGEDNIYNRGPSTDPAYDSSIIAVDFEVGPLLDGITISGTANTAFPWYVRTKPESNELWLHKAAITISSVNNTTGTLTAANSEYLQVGQKVVINGVTGSGSITALSGTYLVSAVQASNEFSLTTLSGSSVSLGGTYTTGSGTITYASFDAQPTLSGTVIGGAPPLVAFGSQSGGTPLYTNQSYNFGVAAGGQLVFNPIVVTSVTSTGTTPTTCALSSTFGLALGQPIVITGANLSALNNTFLINTLTGTSATLKTITGSVVSGITGSYTTKSGTINISTPISIASISNANPSVYTVSSTSGLHVGQMIVISGATVTGTIPVNGTYLISTISGATLKLTDPYGTAIGGVTGYGASSGTITNADFKIEAYQASSFANGNTLLNNVAPVYVQGFTLPRPSASTAWTSFVNNGYVQDYSMVQAISPTTLTISSANSSGTVTTATSSGLQSGQVVIISGAAGTGTGNTIAARLNGIFLASPVTGQPTQLTLTTLTGTTVSLSGTYTTASGTITLLPPPSNITIISANGNLLTTATDSGLQSGQVIVINGATGTGTLSTILNGTFVVSPVASQPNELTLTTLSGSAVNLTDTFTTASGTITLLPAPESIHISSTSSSGTLTVTGTNVFRSGQVVVINGAAGTGSITTALNGIFRATPVTNTSNQLALKTLSGSAVSLSGTYTAGSGIITTSANLINLDTQVQYEAAQGGSSASTWGQQVNYPMLVTHKAANSSFYYKISYMGVTALDNGSGIDVSSVASDSPLAIDSTGTTQVYNVDYTLDFANAPTTAPMVTTLPQFQETPLPPSAQGMSVAELIANSPPVQSSLDTPATLSTTLGFLSVVGNSPELREHPLLDQFVASLNNDPIALANYVLNEVNLTDAAGFNPNNITIASASGTVVTTTAPSNLHAGQTINITGATGSVTPSLNGSFLVGTVTGTTLSLQTLSGTTVTLSGSYTANSGIINTSSIAITSVSGSCELMTSTAHNLQPGEMISISGATVSGTLSLILNGNFLVGATPTGTSVMLTQIGGNALTSLSGTYSSGSGIISTSAQSINPQGVRRGAMATFLEGQGSPTEQCALLIYLLRKAGYPCGYIFPNQDQMLMIDQQLSSMLRMQIQGADGVINPMQVPQLIPVNYPWVAAYINGQWVHIFPWLKNTVVHEGPNLWSYMPTGYQSGGQWLYHYISNDPTIRQLTTPGGLYTDDVNVLFPLYVQQQLEGTNMSIDQLGMTYYNQQTYYTRWQDFPRPWQTPVVTDDNLAQSLDYTQNPTALAPALVNIFDTINIQVFSDRNKNGIYAAGEPSIETGFMRLCDLHDRRLLLYDQVSGTGTMTSDNASYNMILSLEPFDAGNSTSTSNYGTTYNFTGTATYMGGTNTPDPGTFTSQQIASAPLVTSLTGTNDDALVYTVTYNLHQQAQSLPSISSFNFLDVTDNNNNPPLRNTMSLRKGDMACLSLDYGQVTQQMEEFQAEKFWSYQQSAAANPTGTANPELGEGQLLNLVGQSYYYKVSQLLHNTESWTKTNATTVLADGLSKLSPLRDSNNNPVLTNTGTYDILLCYPRVDMAFNVVSWIGNSTDHLNSGDTGNTATDSAYKLAIGGISAYEHLIINQFFQQTAAVSTMKLLDLAQGWSPGAPATNPGLGVGNQPVALTASNYLTLGGTSYSFTPSGTTTSVSKTLSAWCGGSSTPATPAPSGSIWGRIQACFTLTGTNTNTVSQAIVYVTPRPVIATNQSTVSVNGTNAQQFTGVGALCLAGGSYGAYISNNEVLTLSGTTINEVDNGGMGGMTNVVFPQTMSNAQVGTIFLGVASDSSSYFLNIVPANNFTTSVGNTNSTSFFAPDTYSSTDAGALYESFSDGNIVLSAPQATALQNFNTLFAGSATSLTTANAFLAEQNAGYIGSLYYYGTMPSDSFSLSPGVLDPVNSITGEFYVNALDLKLNGPMPLEIRRIYGSLNQANNNFGYGWRMSYFPYLMLTNQAAYNSSNTQLTTTGTLIYAAEMDGSVIAYRQQTSPATRWVPEVQDNPTLANVSGASVGSMGNPFNNRIDQTTATISGTVYTAFTLTGADGSVRNFTVQSFPATSGTTTITRARPYLQKWTDNRGNYYKFSYGPPPTSSSSSPGYGQVTQIMSSNGDFVGFNYDVNGHITQAFTGDGQFLYYQYDAFGDLTQVTLPDASTISYDYQHMMASSSGTLVTGTGTYVTNSGTITSDHNIPIASVSGTGTLSTSGTNSLAAGDVVVISGALGNTAINGIYSVGTVSGNSFTLMTGVVQATPQSTHLITRETKPNGRILQNSYDSVRRVTTQSATVGANESLIQNASFNYGSSTPTATGSTVITDVFGNTTTYQYADNQITSIHYPAQNGSNAGQLSNGPTDTQTWDLTSSSVANGPSSDNDYGQRCLHTHTDRRGLLTTYQYDSAQGNLLSETLTGDLTGSGTTTETSTTTMTYNSSTAVTLPGGGTAIPNTIASVTDQLGNGTTYIYGDSAHPYEPTSINKVASSTTISTDVLQYTDVSMNGASAFGLLQKETIASGTPDQAVVQYTYNGNGFPTSKTASTGTSDPDVTAIFRYDLRGQMIAESDAAGRSTTYTYDALGHRTGAERYDEWGNLVGWNFTYYNQNGEVEWEQGPRYSPSDYVYKQYDGAGRLSQEVKWLSAALVNGSGVAAAGYATTTYQHDAFGNLTSVTDPNLNWTSMGYDAQGEMLSRMVGAPGGGSVLSTEAFTYEPGGQIATHTNRLSDTETRSYTSAGLLETDSMSFEKTSKSYVYDLTGRVVKETLPNGSYWSTVYNDSALTVSGTFYSSSGTLLMTKSRTLDRRGNVISQTDVSGNTFTSTYDGLNRIKTATGPGTSGTTAQQTTSYTYDAAGLVTTVANAAGEKTITYRDALQRPTLITVLNSDGSTAGNTGYWYSPDHQSVVETRGTGANAISTTTYTDTRGNPVLVRHADGTFQAFAYDADGNKTAFLGEQVTVSGSITVSPVTNWTYDALNRVTSEALPALTQSSRAVTNFSYTLSPSGTTVIETVLRQMPESLTAKTVYDSAGRKTSEELDGAGGTMTRNFGYTYYSSNGSGGATGQLQSVSDPRGFTTTTTYDAWGRPATVDSSGSGVSQQNQNTTYTYDNRGMMASVTQAYATVSGTTTPSTQVTRGYDAYGNINAETVSMDANGGSSFSTVSQWAQSWAGTGRRSALNWQVSSEAGSQYAYQTNANGLLTQVINASGTYTYTYGDNNLLQSRTTPWLTQTITSRDNRGRILAENSVHSRTTLLSEALTWGNDDRLATYTPSGSMPPNTATMSYAYDTRGQIQIETYPFSTTGQTPEYYSFDEQDIFNEGFGGLIVFDGVTDESGLGVRTTQYRSVSLSGWDNIVTGQNNFAQVTQDNGSITLGYDQVGNVTSRGSQAMTWDAYNRMVQFSVGSFAWSAVYDGLGRRIQTTDSTNGTVTYYYDPQVEFLELGHDFGGRIWNVYGPDRSGVYGGAGGCGGLEAAVTASTGTINGVTNNYFGDALGSPGSTSSFAGAYNSYGSARGTALNASLQAQWRGRYVDPTGFFYMGTRYYEPYSGRFLSADPLGHASSMSLYDYCNGDPVNGLDPDGRFGKGAIETGENAVVGTGSLLFNIGGTLGYGATSLFSQDYANQTYGSQLQGLQNTLNGIGTLGSQAYNNQWSSIGMELTGGANQSAAYRVGSAAAGIGLIFAGGELGDFGVVGDAGSTTVEASGGMGLIGLVKQGGVIDPSLQSAYVGIANSPQFAASLARYNSFANTFGLTETASVEDINTALVNNTTFAKTSNINAGVFPSEDGSFYLQGNPLTSYGERAGAHELVHLGASLSGQGDTLLHEIGVQYATTPENLVIGGGLIVGGAGAGYYFSH